MACLDSKDGYSIVSGVLTKCATTCKACVSSSTSICTECYSGYAL